MRAQGSVKRKPGFLNSFVFHSLLLAGVLGGLLLLLNGSISVAGESKPTASSNRRKAEPKESKERDGSDRHKPEPKESKDGRGPPRASPAPQKAPKVEFKTNTTRDAKARADAAIYERGGDDSFAPTIAQAADTQLVGEKQLPKQVYTPPKMDVAKILLWSGVVKYVPQPVLGDWMSETEFLERVMRCFGKQRSNYKGYQRMQGFQDKKIFDDDGMFAFTPEVKSVAIDVGAANNPLSFDLDIDTSQVALFVEPLQWLTLQNSIEADSIALKRRGGCLLRWDPVCVMHRFYVFPAAVSNELGHAQFHATDSPYCGSLESFTAESNKSAIDPALRYSKNPEISGIFAACYRDAKGKPGYVPTISLKALIERIPSHIAIKYVKIDAQGHDWNVLLSAGDQIKRIEYVRFEMQVDPPEGRRLVKNIPSYADVESQLFKLGFKHKKGHACFFEAGASPFSKAVNEMECVFCRKLPCVENARPPLGENPRAKVEKQHKAWLKAGKPKKWPPPLLNSSTGSALSG